MFSKLKSVIVLLNFIW